MQYPSGKIVTFYSYKGGTGRSMALADVANRPDNNLRIPMWQLVRAGTAAPVYFPPEIIQWDPSDSNKTFALVDGGMTPYNNPAFLLYRMATETRLPIELAVGREQSADRLHWNWSRGVAEGTSAALNRSAVALTELTWIAKYWIWCLGR
jgi:patatin-like phospholipase/acyl hydrolase